MNEQVTGAQGGARVGIVMGSDSDWPVMQAAAEACREFDVEIEADVVSAHRMPHEMLAYGEQAAERGLSVIIAGAGGAAHLARRPPGRGVRRRQRNHPEGIIPTHPAWKEGGFMCQPKPKKKKKKES